MIDYNTLYKVSVSTTRMFERLQGSERMEEIKEFK